MASRKRGRNEDREICRNNFSKKSGTQPAIEPETDFGLVEDQLKHTDYGVRSILPVYIQQSIEAVKRLTTSQFNRKTQDRIREIISLKEYLAPGERRRALLSPQHVRRVHEERGASICLAHALFEMALRETVDPQIVASRNVIRQLIEQQRYGFPKKSGKIFRTGFWRERQIHELKNKEDLKQPATDERRFNPPRCSPWWSSETWESMMKKVFKQIGTVWLGMKRENLKREAPLDFPVVQKADVRVCTSFIKSNNALVEEEKVRLLGGRACAEIITRCLSDTASGCFEFTGKKDVNEQVRKQKEAAETIKQGRIAVEGSHNKRPSKGCLIGGEEEFSRYVDNFDGLECEFLGNDAVRSSEEPVMVKQQQETQELLPGQFLTDWSGWYHQSPVDDVSLNASWVPVKRDWVERFSSVLDPFTMVEVTLENQERVVDDVDRLQVFGLDARVQSNGQSTITTCWVLVTSEVCLFGDLMSVHACLGRSEHMQFVFNTLFSCPCTIWVDDSHGHARPRAVPVACNGYGVLCCVMGRTVADKKTLMMHEVQQKLVALGLGYEMCKDEEILISIPPDKKRKFSELITESIKNIRGDLVNELDCQGRSNRKSFLTKIVPRASIVHEHISDNDGESDVILYFPEARIPRGTAKVLAHGIVEKLGKHGWNEEHGGRLAMFFVDGAIDVTYRYGRTSLRSKGDIPAELGEMARQASDKMQVPATARPTLTINVYKSDSKDFFSGIPIHRDDERLFEANAKPVSICAVSLGDSASFILKRDRDQKVFELPLVSGSFLAMMGMTQLRFRHAIEPRRKEEHEMGIRISFTFRWIPPRRSDGTGYVRQPTVKRKASALGMQQVAGLYRWRSQIDRIATFFAGNANAWCQEEFFEKHIKIQYDRRNLIQILLRFETFVLENPGIRLSKKKVRTQFTHSMGDASGEFTQVQFYQKQHLGERIPPLLMWEAQVWIGGFIRVPNGVGGSTPKAWRIQVTNVPQWASDVALMHIGLFELMGVFLSLSFALAAGVNLKELIMIQHVDNLGDVYILVRAATACRLTRAMSIAFYEFCRQHDLSVYPAWLSGQLNVMADAASRVEKLPTLQKVEPEVSIFHYDESWMNQWWDRIKDVLTAIEYTDAGGIVA